MLCFSGVQAHNLGERLIDVDVIADGGLPIGIHVLCGRISGRCSVTQGTPLLDVFGNKCCNLIDGRDR